MTLREISPWRLVQARGTSEGFFAHHALTEGIEKLQTVLRRIRSADVEPSLILTSPYRRARQTAEIAARILRLAAS